MIWRWLRRSVDFIARESGVFGSNSWRHGLIPENQIVLEKFALVCPRAGLYPPPTKLDDFFAVGARHPFCGSNQTF
jgi:hypothetical protein